jgi:hypothetical protein
LPFLQVSDLAFQHASVVCVDVRMLFGILQQMFVCLFVCLLFVCCCLNNRAYLQRRRKHSQIFVAKLYLKIVAELQILFLRVWLKQFFFLSRGLESIKKLFLAENL